MNKVADLTM